VSRSLRELNEQKLGVFTRLSGLGKVLVVCDPTSFGVRVPDWLKKEYGNELTLRFGFKNGQLSVDAQGVSETLSFKGTPQRVSIPWSAVQAMVGEDGKAWIAPGPDDVEPPAVAAAPVVAPVEPEKPAFEPPAEQTADQAPRPRPKLRLVPDPDSEHTS
jgi:stringent starvation protein B